MQDEERVHLPRRIAEQLFLESDTIEMLTQRCATSAPGEVLNLFGKDDSMKTDNKACCAPGNGRWRQSLRERLLLLAFWLFFPIVAWSQGGQREAVLIIEDTARAVALQTNGKIVVAGHSDNDLALARYNSDGSLDISFGTSSKVPPEFDVWGHSASALAIQQDGKIVVTGVAYVHGNDFALRRYNVDGSLDTTFGTDGKVTTDLSGDYDAAFALAIQEDDKLVVAGLALSKPKKPTNPLVAAGRALSNFALVRYNPDGSLDSGFGAGGKVLTPIRSTIGAHTLALQPDGKLVAAGISEGSFALARYNPDGSLDSSFGTDGKVTTSIGAGIAVVYALALQKDGKSVVAGIAFDEHDFGFALARYNPDGRLDPGFGTGRKVTTAIGIRSDETHPFGPLYTHKTVCRLCGVAIQPDGKIMVTGSALSEGRFTFALVRYNADGSLDKSFGKDGKVTTLIGTESRAYALAIQADGKLVVAGSTQVSARESNFALARYNPDGNLDESFGEGGKVVTRIGAGVIRS